MTVKIRGTVFPLLYSFFISGGLLLCLSLSIILHYRQVTRNHCRVEEYFPSVSSSIGDHSPERNIWPIAIALGSGPRFISALLNRQVLLEGLPTRTTMLNIAFFIDLSRIIFAGAWTYLSSSDYLLFHEVSFVMYMVASFVWCGIHTQLFHAAKVAGKKQKEDQQQQQQQQQQNLLSYRWKLFCFVNQFVLFFISLYFFLVEHQQQCLPGAYSRYSICEWIVAVNNILYDASCSLDFKEYTLTLGKEEKKQQ